MLSSTVIVTLVLADSALLFVAAQFADLLWPLLLLAGVETLVLDGLRPRKHPTHFSIDESVQVARRVGARVQHESKELVDPRTYAPDLPPALCSLILDCLRPAGEILLRHFGKDVNDPLSYHLVINTDMVSPGKAVQLIGYAALDERVVARRAATDEPRAS